MDDFILVSDLHIDENSFDFDLFKHPDNKDRVLLNLGDTFTHTLLPAKYIVGAMNKASHHFKQVIFVLGNHDYYGATIEETRQEVRDLLKALNNPKIIFLEIDTYPNGYNIPGTDIVVYGDTMWSNMPFGKEENIEDYMKIYSADRTSHLKFTETNKINKIFIDKLKEFLLNDDIKGQKVILTHFPPLYIDQGYPISWLTSYFHNDGLVWRWFGENWMNGICWLHGHTHLRYMLKQNDTYLYSNARGYKISGFHPALVTI